MCWVTMGTTCASHLLSLKWEASKFMENPNHTEGLLKHRLLGSHPQRYWCSWSRVAFENLHFSQATCDVNASGAQEDNPRSFVKRWSLGPPPGFWFNWSGCSLDVRIVKAPRWFARTAPTENHWGLWEKPQTWLRFLGSEGFLGFHGQSVDLPRWGLPGSGSLRVRGKLSFASHTSKPISLKPSQLFADAGINAFWIWTYLTPWTSVFPCSPVLVAHLLGHIPGTLTMGHIRPLLYLVPTYTSPDDLSNRANPQGLSHIPSPPHLT